MKNSKYALVGMVFGLALTKGEAISWYRIQEMFRFESFHMFGIFMTAIPTGALTLWLLRKTNAKTFEGEALVVPQKKYHRGVPGPTVCTDRCGFFGCDRKPAGSAGGHLDLWPIPAVFARLTASFV
jgi:hypothetical protein